MNLNEILKKHEMWLEGKEGGERANLEDADLRYANLKGSDLRRTNLINADLEGANLECADLENSNLRNILI